MKPAGALQSRSAQPEQSIRELDRKVYAQKIFPRVEDGEIKELRGIQSGGGLQSYRHRFSLVACPFALYTAPIFTQEETNTAEALPHGLGYRSLPSPALLHSGCSVLGTTMSSIFLVMNSAIFCT